MTTANTSAITITATVRDHEPAGGTPRSWALTLAAVALLGLALLGLVGVELGTTAQAAADTDRAGVVAVLEGLDTMVAGIRWVR